MTVELVRDFLAWCLVVNIVALLAWWLLFMAMGDWICKWHGRWFGLPEERVRTMHYGGMLLFKGLIFLFNLAPYLALRIVGP